MKQFMSPIAEMYPLAVSAPGGMPRHFRIQYRENDKSSWQLFAIYLQPEAAKESMAGLLEDGNETRMIAYRKFPAAA